MQILRDTREVNDGGFSAALKMVDEKCALDRGGAGDGRWRETDAESVNKAPLSLYHNST